jgi:ankyrin repeat protein
MPKPLSENPSLENLRKQAKRLCKGVRTADPASLAEVRELLPGAATERFSLADAQRAVARRYGFSSWSNLKAQLMVVERFGWDPTREPAAGQADAFLRLACLAYGDWHPDRAVEARRMLQADPTLARATIYTAAAVGAVAAARSMLDADPALVNARGGPLGWEPLLYVCYSRLDSADPDHAPLEVARLLLSRGADPNAGFLWRGLVPPFTALTGAFGEGEDGNNSPAHPQALALARLLLEAGADPNDGQTLYNRQWSRSDEHLELLLAHGLGRGKGGPWYQRLGERMGTPQELLADELWSATVHGRTERAKLLIAHGAELDRPTSRADRRSRDGATPYEAALLAGNRALAEHLAQHGAVPVVLDPLRELSAACLAGDAAEVRALLDGDPDLLERLGPEGRAALVHKAVDARRLEGIRLMATLGFDLSAMTGNTPLHSAAWSGDLELVQLLVELGADPNARDPDFQATPLGWAEHNHQQRVVEYLGPLTSARSTVTRTDQEKGST